MPSITACYCRRFSVLHDLWQFFMGGARWSHCGIVVGSSVVEALTKGVVMTPVNDWIHRYPAVDFVDIECPDPKAAEAFAIAQLGKKYDWLGCFGVPWRARWHDDSKWYCSELVEASLIAGGRHRWRLEKTGVSPMESWIVI